MLNQEASEKIIRSQMFYFVNDKTVIRLLRTITTVSWAPAFQCHFLILMELLYQESW